jgi:hypothetical protein
MTQHTLPEQRIVVGRQYKIRRSDGKFSKGGHSPQFSKEGKTWRTSVHLAGHLRQVRNLKVYSDCEVVEYQVVEAGARPLVDVVAGMTKPPKAMPL